MESEYTAIRICCDYILNKSGERPELAVVLGSGLGGLADRMDGVQIAYQNIPGMPVSTVSGHAGRFVFGTLGGKKTVAMQGRVHFYEGYSMAEVVRPIRVMRALGADKLILTNAAGAVNECFSPGDLVMISDHILSFVPSPLIGENVSQLGARFPDMSAVYSPRMRNIAKNCAADLKISLKSGVYVQTTGPNYETPAEINMMKQMGADMVGMSTACEATAAKHAGMEVCAVSVISNMAAGISKTALSHSEVQMITNKASKPFQALICKLAEMI